MNCPTCKAWALAKETRKRQDGSMYRRYECANLHRFSTRETAVPDKLRRAKGD